MVCFAAAVALAMLCLSPTFDRKGEADESFHLKVIDKRIQKLVIGETRQFTTQMRVTSCRKRKTRLPLPGSCFSFFQISFTAVNGQEGGPLYEQESSKCAAAVLVFISPLLGSDDNPKSGGRVAGAFGGISCMNAVLSSLPQVFVLLAPALASLHLCHVFHITSRSSFLP